jgi:hypothetical protein
MKTRCGPEEWTVGSFGRQRRRRYEAGGRSRDSPFSFFFSLHNYVRGTHTPRCAHSARMRVEDFLCCDLRQGPRSVSFVFPLFSVVYIPLRGEKTVNETQSINQSTRLHPVSLLLINSIAIEPERGRQRVIFQFPARFRVIVAGREILQGFALASFSK